MIRDHQSGLRRLRELGLDRTGVICVDRVDAALTGQPVPAGDHVVLLVIVGAPGLTAQRAIWRRRSASVPEAQRPYFTPAG